MHCGLFPAWTFFYVNHVAQITNIFFSELAGPEGALEEEKYNRKLKISKDLSLEIKPKVAYF